MGYNAFPPGGIDWKDKSNQMPPTILDFLTWHIHLPPHNTSSNFPFTSFDYHHEARYLQRRLFAIGTRRHPQCYASTVQLLCSLLVFGQIECLHHGTRATRSTSSLALSLTLYTNRYCLIWDWFWLFALVKHFKLYSLVHYELLKSRYDNYFGWYDIY